MATNLNAEFAALKRMTPTQLRAKYLQVFGEASRSGNKDFLFKRIAWRIQSLAEGDLSERARQRAAELARDADIRVTIPRLPRQPQAGPGKRSSIASTDLFIARVGRACLTTLGPVVGFRPVSWSDCVFRLRAKEAAPSPSTLLLSLHLVGGMPAIGQMIERGVGATYITESELGGIPVPTKLETAFPRWFAAYVKADKNGHKAQMRQIEQRLRSHIIRPIGALE